MLKLEVKEVSENKDTRYIERQAYYDMKGYLLSYSPGTFAFFAEEIPAGVDLEEKQIFNYSSDDFRCYEGERYQLKTVSIPAWLSKEFHAKYLNDSRFRAVALALIEGKNGSVNPFKYSLRKWLCEHGELTGNQFRALFKWDYRILRYYGY